MFAVDVFVLFYFPCFDNLAYDDKGQLDDK